MPRPTPRTHALILAGGAAYAAYEVGVVKALVDGLCPATNGQPIVPRIVAGSSGGAFNAALLVSASAGGVHNAVAHLEGAWLNDVAETGQTCGNGVFRLRLDPTTLVDLACLREGPLPLLRFVEDSFVMTTDFLRRGARLLTSNTPLEQRLTELIDLETFVSSGPMRAVLGRTIAPAAIRSADWILQVAAINWQTGALRIFDNADFVDSRSVDIVQAATAIPGLFPSVDIGGEPYVDASMVLDTPLKPPIDAGADVLHVVYFNPDVDRLPLPRVRNTASTMTRALLITLGALINRDIEMASRVNLALDVMRRGTGPVLPGESSALLRETGSREAHEGDDASAPHRRLEIHRYHAREPLGATFRWLSFGRDHVEALIEQGLEDTKRHDCRANGCVVND